MPSILFLCTGNRFRSPIAAAAFLNMLTDSGNANKWKVESAGTWTIPGLPADQRAIQSAEQLGLNIKNHISRSVSDINLLQYNLILVMEAGHKEAMAGEFSLVRDRIFLLSEVVEGIPYDIPDPLSAGESSTQEIAVEVCNLVWKGFDKICQLAYRLSSTNQKALEFKQH